MIGIIFSLLAFLLSPFGLMGIMAGVLAFIILPFIPRMTGVFKSIGHFYFWLGMRMLNRAIVVVSEHGDLLLKRMHPDDIGTERVKFNEGVKEFNDLDGDQAKKSLFGIPFAFGDEVHGFLFGIRHALLGSKKKHARENDAMVAEATKQEREEYGVYGWVNAVFSFSATAYEFANLNHVRHLVTGNERADDPQRIKTYYEHSRDPYDDGPSSTRFLLILAAMLGPFLTVALIKTQLMGGGGGGAGPVVSGLLGGGGAAAPAIREKLRAIDWKTVLLKLVLILPVVAVFGVIVLFAGPIFAVMIGMAVFVGFAIGPILIQILKLSDGMTHSLSRLLLKMGLLAYDNPTIVELPTKYTLKEQRNLTASSDRIVKHPFLGRQVGFTVAPTPAQWETEVIEKETIDSQAVETIDTKTNLPPGNHIIPEWTRAVYGSFVPKRLSNKQYYLKVGVALSRFKNVATGEKTFHRLEQAKEEFGGSNQLSEKTMIITMSVLSVLSLGSGIGVFFFI